MNERRSIAPDVIGGGGESSPDSDRDRTVSLSSLTEPWTPYFPFDEPYTDQVEGVNEFINALSDHEYMVMEGACGTGKTLIGLVGGIYATRNTSKYRRVLIATPVKQQLKQFIEEMQTINAQLDANPVVKTVVARGKQDMSPYADVDIEPFDTTASLHDTLRDMRDATIELIKFDSEVPLQWPDEMNPPAYSRYDGDWDNAREGEDLREQFKYDPHRARAVIRTWGSKNGDRFTVHGYESPYPDRIPKYEDVVRKNAIDSQSSVGRNLGNEYIDPFYAGYFSYENLPFGFSDASEHVMTGERLLELSIEAGVLPHEALAKLMQKATVVIGNYYHVFDTDRTRLLTDTKADILDGETITILDDAHNLESNIRDMLSKTVGSTGLSWAKADLETALGYLNKDKRSLPPGESPSDRKIQQVGDDISHLLNEADIDKSDLGRAISMFSEIHTYLFDRTETYLDAEFDGGSSAVLRKSYSELQTDHVALEDPETDGEDDEFTQSMDSEMIGWVELLRISKRVEGAFEAIDAIDRTPVIGDVGEFFYTWANADGYDYFRELELEPSSSGMRINSNYSWSENYIPSYSLYNTIPTEHIRAVLSELGGGLLMSATLEPLDAYISTTGVNECIHPDSVEEKDDRFDYVKSGRDQEPDIEHRNVRTIQFPLRFPRENRESLIVTARKYTASNRGYRSTRDTDMTSVRRTYANIVTDIAQTRGNVLLAFPSYAEAKWAHDVLETRISKPVHVDSSSGVDETNELLDKFTGDSHAVVLTSARGTITEGVDYAGDLLHTAAVIGVSLTPPTDRHTAVQNAYDTRLDGVGGWEAADLIPAARKARQAIGRVLRGSDELGVRVFVDERYAKTGWGGVNGYLSDQEQHEFTTISPNNVGDRIRSFWETRLD